MSGPFSVRVADRSDAAIIARHRAEMFLAMGELQPQLYEPLVRASRRYFEAAIPVGEYIGWLAFAAGRPGEIVAGAGVQLRPILPRPYRGGSELMPGPQGLILNVFTEEAWRRQGLAALLTRHVIAWARGAGVASLVLHASRDGRPLYEQLGFVESNEMRYAGE